MHTYKLQIPKTARVSYSGSFENCKRVWIVLHGYGQLSDYFIKHFDVLNDGTTLVVAPEALSRFYTQGLSGRVGASWMTKEEREHDIQDNNQYLDLLWEDLKSRIQNPDPELFVLGFSQGTALAFRWLLHSGIRPAKLIQWAGMFPSDVSMPDLTNLLGETDAHIVYGTKDPYLTDDTIKNLYSLAEHHHWKVQYHTFEGEHTLNPDILRRLNS